MLGLDVRQLSRDITTTPRYQMGGRLTSAAGVLTCSLQAAVGEQCAIERQSGPPVLAEVIGFKQDVSLLMPFDRTDDLRRGMTVLRQGKGLMVPTGPRLLGRVLDGLGRPLDNKGPIVGCPLKSLHRPAPPALDRTQIETPFVTGVRAIDGLLTCGLGQRIGIFSGSGVGKSTLLGEIARNSNADVNVIALIGERGREVKPFLEKTLGPEGMAKSVVVYATSDQTPLMRVRATQAAIAIADHFRDGGVNVLFMIDSLTRLAHAQREIGQMLGEPPTARGYTPSVFQMLANVIERLGNASVGGITALLTVLVDGGDMDEPIADAVRGFVDGHIVLDRKIAERDHYPAINVGRSLSRLAAELTDKDHAKAARKLRAIMGTYAEVEDLIRIGQYKRGEDQQADKAIDLMPAVVQFLKQDQGTPSGYEQTRAKLLELTAHWQF